ncbi:hypothetical protein F444_04824 [Phytophthora nicotianae P1976]|uniref:DDE Tnp4 domain-containing protein n=1 Tax=Phytophthora nicotianae P1976 TaxID=1317066 RepID=A0A081AP97_PHYNI|nr:hypothetical protein F444_04824 [Phytophthora nicotianae P1976]
MTPSQTSTPQDLNRLLPPERVAEGVSILTQLDADRQSRRQSVSSVRLDNDNDDIDSPSPIYHQFLREDTQNIAALTNFAPLEFECLWNSIRAHVADHWNVGRGRKSKQQPKDVLFMFLVVLKHCGKWDVVANVFRIKTGTFQKMILSFAEVVSPYLYEKYVVSAAGKFTMEALVLVGNTFRNYPSARYATDVTFQQSNMPTGQIKERRAYYSAKHHLHGYKVEVSELPNGLALNCTAHYPGSEADIQIFRKNHEFHLQHLLKSSMETELADEGPLTTEHSDSWAVLADNGYQGLAADFRAITPFKKQPLRELTLEHVETKDRIAYDRGLVKNYFGRLCTLWAMCSDKYREDGTNYHNYLKRLCVISHDASTKKLAVQRRYREKRHMRLRRMLVAHVDRPGSRSTRQRESDEESEDFFDHESIAFA